jgi:RND family efflux transporter MFP subunit
MTPAVRGLLLGTGAVVLFGVAAAPLLMRRSQVEAAQPPLADATPVVTTVPVQTRSLQRTVRLNGVLKSGSDATLSPAVGGRVVSVLVRPGQAVRRGEPLVRLDPAAAQGLAAQAAAGADAARAQWRTAEEGQRLRATEVERRISEARSGVEQARLQIERAEAGIRLRDRAAGADVARAQAGVDAARSALASARKGASAAQRRQLQIQARQAERGIALARTNYSELEQLHARGGIPRLELDEARERLQGAEDGLAQIEAQLEQLEASPEEVGAAEAQVRSAEAALQAARAAAEREEVDRAEIAAAQAGLRRAEAGLASALASRAELEVAASETRAARAAYEQAREAAQLAARQVGETVIQSPFEGTVSEVFAAVGEMAGPGLPLVRVLGRSGVYLEAAVSARHLEDLHPGADAAVTVDALPGQVFPGAVRTVSRAAGTDGRSFTVAIDLSAGAGLLQAGAAARAVVTVERHEAALAVPRSALRTDDGETSVWVIRRNVLEEVPVEVGLRDGDLVQVVGDLRPDDLAALPGLSSLRPGDPVRTQPRLTAP